jgi:hypothetical protein
MKIRKILTLRSGLAVDIGTILTVDSSLEPADQTDAGIIAHARDYLCPQARRADIHLPRHGNCGPVANANSCRKQACLTGSTTNSSKRPLQHHG